MGEGHFQNSRADEMGGWGLILSFWDALGLCKPLLHIPGPPREFMRKLLQARQRVLVLSMFRACLGPQSANTEAAGRREQHQTVGEGSRPVGSAVPQP